MDNIIRVGILNIIFPNTYAELLFVRCLCITNSSKCYLTGFKSTKRLNRRIDYLFCVFPWVKKLSGTRHFHHYFTRLKSNQYKSIL